MRRTIKEDAAGLYVEVDGVRQYVRALAGGRFAAGDRVKVMKGPEGAGMAAYLVHKPGSSGQADRQLIQQPS